MFSQLSDDDRSKIELLAKCTLLGVLNAMHHGGNLPLHIYGMGIYSDKQRGKEALSDEQKTTRNQNRGIMKGHMPLAANDVARSESEIPYLKPSDQATYKEGSAWVQNNFDKLVHPFSNSISGTFLCQLRSLAGLRNNGITTFTESVEKFAQYSQLLISALLFNSGGHTLNEFTAPLSLDSVKLEFQSMKGFENTNLESMYLTNNESAFNQALQDAIRYNNQILLKKELHAEIKDANSLINKVPEPDEKQRIEKKVNLYKDILVEKLTQECEAISAMYKNRVDKQLFSAWRAGSQKNILIQNGIKLFVEEINHNALDAAGETLKQLKTQLASDFGKTNFLGRQPESLRIIDGLEKKLDSVKKQLDQREKTLHLESQSKNNTAAEEVTKVMPNK